MGLIKKFSKIIRANVNNWLDHAENPQKLAQLALLEAENSKKKAESLMIKAQAALNLSKAELESLKARKSHSLDQPPIDKEIAQVEQEKATHQNSIDIIKRGLKALDQHINMLKSKASLFTDQVNDTSAFDTFERMEDKIEASEAEIEALKELFLLAQKEQAPNTFPKARSSLEEELEALKKKLNKE